MRRETSARKSLTIRKQIIPVSAKFRVNVAHKFLTMLMDFLFKDVLRCGWSHIPSPCGAASLQLPLWTGHETNILVSLLLNF